MTGLDEDLWFTSHVEVAAQEVIDFFAVDGLSFENARVADLGSGDGLIDLGIALRARPRELVGFDVDEPPSTETLVAELRRREMGDALPDGLEFRRSSQHAIPAPDGSFDFAFSWSTFQFLLDVPAMCAELARTLVPGGALMIQLYPFYASEHGDNAADSPPFAHLITGVSGAPEGVVHNRLTLDNLQRALLDAGFRISHVSVIHDSFHLPAELAEWPLSALSITGVKLLALRLACATNGRSAD